MKVKEHLTIKRSSQRDIDYVERHFRKGDKLEHDSLGGGRTRVKDFEQCWTIRFHGKTIGYCGVGIPYGETFFSGVRWLCYMSTTNADKVKMSYVKLSREVMKAIAAKVMPHVTYFMSLPNKAYHGSVIWHERVLKMTRLRELRHKGQDFVLFGIARKELV